MLALLAFVWQIFNLVLRGFVIKLYWAWFLLTVFPQLPKLEVLPAIGLVYMVSILIPYKGVQQEDWDKIKNREVGDRTTLHLVNAGIQSFALAVLMGTGWVLHAIMRAYGY